MAMWSETSPNNFPTAVIKSTLTSSIQIWDFEKMATQLLLNLVV